MTITLTREEAQQVLDAFEGVFEGDDKGAEFWTVNGGTFEAVYCMNAMRLLRAKLAEPWTPDDTAYRPGGLPQPEPVAWRGLTTAETKALWNVTKKPTEFADLLQAKLREKNT